MFACQDHSHDNDKKWTVNSHVKKNMHCVLNPNVNIDYKHLKHVQNDVMLLASAMNLHRNAYHQVTLNNIFQKE